MKRAIRKGYIFHPIYMGVSKNRGTPKWMVYKEHPIKMDDLGVPLFLETPIYNCFFMAHLVPQQKAGGLSDARQDEHGRAS